MESLGDRLLREGALPLDDVLRLVPPVCDALVRLGEAGVRSTASLTSVQLVDGAPSVTPVPFEGTPRDQVKAVAALTYELLKGLPPPEAPSSQDFIGLRPEIVRPVHAALVGTGASDLLTFARQLRSLGSGGTAQYEKPPVPDTKVSSKVKAVEAPGHVGQIFGAWELVRKLGAGGMGEVYVGRHTRLGREVAIKVLRDEYASMPDVVHRFFQEAKVVNDLKHPNTVEILDFVEEPGRVYLVMELLEGRTLAELDREQGPLPLRRVCHLLAQACEALGAAHRHGVVHRDIKPDNLFVVEGDRLKVLDFGVARRVSGGPQTQAGLVLGTPFYMAPEQAAGRAVDARADLYALGVSLYELLTRDSMSTVTTPQRILRAASGEPVPEALTGLVASLLALDPSQRPASADAVKAVLLSVAGLPPPPPAPTTGQAMVNAGLSSTPRARWVVPGLSVLGLGVVVAALALRSPARVDPPEPRPSEPRPEVLAPVVLVPTPPPEPAPAEPQPPADPPSAPKPTRGTPRDRKVEPPPLARAEPPPAVVPEATGPVADPMAPLRARLDDVRRRFQTLVSKYGEAQLTTLEKAAVAETLAAAAAGDQTQLSNALPDAEQALSDAERRLGR
ncbi:MAG: serine/threonine protein kinase [Myxococcaceae bacterium]|jgi:serine/threonine-protein kinase|nr:serine/threonine protein kinase [Myxococcaceae bacterium]